MGNKNLIIKWYYNSVRKKKEISKESGHYRIVVCGNEIYNYANVFILFQICGHTYRQNKIKKVVLLPNSQMQNSDNIRTRMKTSISSEAPKNQTSILIRGRENHVSPKTWHMDIRTDISNYKVASLLKIK